MFRFVDDIDTLVFVFCATVAFLFLLLIAFDSIFFKKNSEYRKGFNDCAHGLPCKSGKSEEYEQGFSDCYAQMANDDARTDR